MQDRELPPVRQLKGDDVAFADAEPHEPGRDPIGETIEVAVGEANPIAALGARRDHCNVDSSPVAITKRALFNIMDDDNNNKIDSADSDSLGCPARIYAPSETATIHPATMRAAILD